jgi:Uma2 family endonuclease
MVSTTRLTAEEYLAGRFPRESQLINGELVIIDPRLRHQQAVARTLRALEDWSGSPEGHGIALFGGNWVLGPDSVVKPDVWWVADPARIDLDLVFQDTAPDLVVEVRSPGTWHLDVGPKKAIYEAAGVAELWLVDLPAEAVLVHRRSRTDAPAFDATAELGADEALTSPLLPGFALDLTALFA